MWSKGGGKPSPPMLYRTASLRAFSPIGNKNFFLRERSQ